MTLVNELETEIALAFLVDKTLAEPIDSNEVLKLLNRVRDILDPDLDNEETIVTTESANSISH